jgi:hypothetical protein
MSVCMWSEIIDLGDNSGGEGQGQGHGPWPLLWT